MLHYVVIVQRETGLPLFDYQAAPNFIQIKPELISGLLTALRSLTAELKIGELSKFDSMNKKVIISVGKHVYAALVVDIEESDAEWENNASTIVEEFEKKYNLESFNGDLKTYQSFTEVMDKLMIQFEWKEGEKHLISNHILKGFIIYDTKNKVYYNYSNLSMEKIMELLQYSYNLHLLNKNSIQIQEKDTIQLFIKTDDEMGSILIFDSKITKQKLDRTVKTIQFLIRNLYAQVSFKKQYTEAAKLIFTEEEFKWIFENDQRQLIEILALSENPLEVVELIRRCDLRNFVELK